MQRSYLDYAMSVIVGRALPDVRDGLKPVHRRVLYAMYDGGYRPDRQYSKCTRVLGDVMGQYHPHGDGAIYDTLVRLVQKWVMRYPLVDGQGNFGSPGNLGAAAHRYTECRMAPLAMELVRDIGEETVDFVDNYDGRTQEPSVLPSRFPNLLVNGSAGIAVGMATNIPPHNLREVAAAVQYALENPDLSGAELLDGLMERVQGPDFPTAATILGRAGIEDAYRTGRGSITMRAIVEVEELQGRTCLVVTELPYQVNPDNLAEKIAEMVKEGRLAGVADIRDETSGRTGQRLVVVLKRDAVAKVVLNNLYKHTQLQYNFSANMLALVDGVPRTLSLDGFITHWIEHQLEVIQRRTQYRLRQALERQHLLIGYLRALENLDEVIALIRRSPTVEDARNGLMELLDVDETQARAILAMQLRQLAALERQKIVDEYEELTAQIEDYREILATPQRQRDIVSTELAAIVDKYGDERRTRIMPSSAEVSMEDLIPEEEVVVTITRGGYAKRTRADSYRAQRRGGRGIRGAALRGDDVVEHFFTTSTHHWLLFFTNLGRVYRAKAYELPEGARDSKGQHVANLLAFQPDERIAQVVDLAGYDDAPYLVLATRDGLVKKSRLADYDSPRTGGLIAVKLRDGDELVAARLVRADDDLLLVSRKGMSIRFTADDATLRPMGRDTSGVTGMRFRDGDSLLSAAVVPAQMQAESEQAESAEGDDGVDAAGGSDDAGAATVDGGSAAAPVAHDVLVITENGYAKRTPVSAYRVQGRAGYGIKVARASDERGDLVASLITTDGDEVLVIMQSGRVMRSRVADVRSSGRDTYGVILTRTGDTVLAATLNSEVRNGEDEPSDAEDGVEGVDEDGGAAQPAGDEPGGEVTDAAPDAVPSSGEGSADPGREATGGDG
ncbi:DNA gyrase subunit A [Aquipuribacter sp. SD81]|uniref:DNA gyrase subunit A n=1 Tax=Aquipuribacter sp. SD81 TaxID=3127703 RepID=UPI003FA59EDA